MEVESKEKEDEKSQSYGETTQSKKGSSCEKSDEMKETNNHA